MTTQRKQLAAFAEAIPVWLRKERATIPQAMALHFALEAGIIEGAFYDGVRDYGGLRSIESVEHRYGSIEVEAALDRDPDDNDESDSPCGCLLHTLEHGAGIARAQLTDAATDFVFACATHIAFGDTPKTNPWARAAVKGIGTYIASKER